MTDNFRILIFNHSFQTHAAHGSGKICTQFRVSVIFSKHELCESAYLTVIGVCLSQLQANPTSHTTTVHGIGTFPCVFF